VLQLPSVLPHLAPQCARFGLVELQVGELT
jgi:hypothetical protein